MSGEVTIPDEAIEMAARTLTDKVDQGMPVPGYLRDYAQATVRAAAPLTVAAYIDGVLDDWYHNRIKGQTLAEYLGKAASVLRGEGDRDATR